MDIVKYETLVFMHPSLVCNFSCVYCGQHTNDTKAIKEIDIGRVLQRLDKLNRTLLVDICGGEPFMIPNLTEFVHELTKKHYVRMDSNLSLTEACRKFADTIDPERVVEFNFSTHVLEREKRKMDLGELVSLVKELQAKGFKMVGNYVAYPTLFERMEKDINYFKSHGITVLPTLFHGTYNGIGYPLDNGRISYSEEEIRLIRRFNPYAVIPFHSPKDEFCPAGCAAFCVNDRYEVFPCFQMQIYKHAKLGDFFGEWRTSSKVLRCPVEYCVDQYNKSFNGGLDRFYMPYMFLRAISERGAASRMKSLFFWRNFWKRRLLDNIKNIARPLKRGIFKLLRIDNRKK